MDEETITLLDTTHDVMEKMAKSADLRSAVFACIDPPMTATMLQDILESVDKLRNEKDVDLAA
jgi:hypothetical protein